MQVSPVTAAVATAVMGAALVLAPARAGVPPTRASFARGEVAVYQKSAGPSVDCTGPAGNPVSGSTAWTLRDVDNQYCATRRLVDELDSPAFAAAFASQTPSIFTDQTVAQLGSPGHLHASLGQLVPGGTTADPFRTVARWTAAGRGRVSPISFTSSDGALLNGYLFEPPLRGRPGGPYAGVVITTGSLQGYQQLYFWAAEGLAEAGYVVMTYDVQGQGDSDTLPASCTVTACPGVPFQQSYNFYQGAEDALNWFLSTPASPYVPPHGNATHNPLWSSIDRAEIGIAGHSLGASAVSEVGQCDKRVQAVVAWDNLAPVTEPCAASVDIAAGRSTGAPPLRTPALGLNSEYFLNPEPMTSVPDPHAKDAGYQQLVHAGDNAMQVALRSSMHLEYSYIPYILPASSLGERVAFYYTLAWFDYYLRHMPSGYQRLVASRFDGSSDAHSIGAGTYSTTEGNVPYAIAGLPVVDRLSFYYESGYNLSPPSAGGGPASGTPIRTCADLRAACPAKAPPTP